MLLQTLLHDLNINIGQEQFCTSCYVNVLPQVLSAAY